MTYKFGSTRMGTEAHAYGKTLYYISLIALYHYIIAVDIKWLGIHHNDLFNERGQPIVNELSLQTWSESDDRVYTGLINTLSFMVSNIIIIIDLSGIYLSI